MGSKILNKYRPSLPERVKKAGKGVYFQEFIQYIVDGAEDAHWKGPYSTQCEPCIVDYDAIIKLETFSADVPQVIAKLEGRSQQTKANSFSQSHWNDHFIKNLKQYGNVTQTQLQTMARKYKLDFAQFGYDYVERNDSIDISCQMKTAKGDICC